MAWLVIHCRERELMVSGADAGRPTFTREAVRALRFANADKARAWITASTITAFGELALLREAGSRAEHPRARAAGHYRPREST